LRLFVWMKRKKRTQNCYALHTLPSCMWNCFKWWWIVEKWTYYWWPLK
jgi:hypothetical protein